MTVAFRCAALWPRFLLLICGAGAAAEPFPFGQELLLDAAPMRPGKRMPILTVEANGDARIDLWCRTVPARVEIADMAMESRRPPCPKSCRPCKAPGNARRSACRQTGICLCVCADDRLAT